MLLRLNVGKPALNERLTKKAGVFMWPSEKRHAHDDFAVHCLRKPQWRRNREATRH
jgi:hypothetical protein